MKVMGGHAPDRKLCISCDVLNVPNRDNSTELLLGLLASQTLKIASINGFKELENLEDELEAEIQWENRAPPREILEKIRRKGEHYLHAKFCLLAIVILNVIDCCLVIGALLIEFHHMQNLIQMKDDNAETFLNKMETKYPNDISGITAKTIYKLYEDILVSDVAWNNGSACINDTCNSKFSVNCTQDYYSNGEVDTLFFDHGGKTHYIEEKVSHILHYLSITILAILLIETAIKIFCTVPRFFRQRLQVFDAFVVLVSFILDLVFIDGFLNLDIGEFVLAVTFILPWRIIRILNSLIVAVMEKERYTLKMLYKQKKKVDKANSEAHEKIRDMEKKIGDIKKVCDKHNVPSWEIKNIINEDEKTTSSALSKLAFHAAGSLTPAPMTNESTSSNPFIQNFRNGIKNNQSDCKLDNTHTDLTSNGNLNTDRCHSMNNILTSRPENLPNGHIGVQEVSDEQSNNTLPKVHFSGENSTEVNIDINNETVVSKL